jgi:hypothetical protein
VPGGTDQGVPCLCFLCFSHRVRVKAQSSGTRSKQGVDLPCFRCLVEVLFCARLHRAGEPISGEKRGQGLVHCLPAIGLALGERRLAGKLLAAWRQLDERMGWIGE